MTISVIAEINSARAVAGAAVFNGALASMRTGVASTGAAISTLGRALTGMQGILLLIAGGGLVAAGRSAINAGDSFSQLRARLDNTSKAGTSADALLQGLAASAERARAPVSALADLYRRNAEALTGLGFSEAQGIRLAETLAKVTKVSGTSATEAAAGMLQLSQAIVSGKFQGDEFRSVAENMPEVLRILERQLGKTSKELREMAEAGQLSGKLLAGALLNAGQSVDDKFSKMPKTVGEAFAQLKDKASLAFGEIMAQSETSKTFVAIFENMGKAIASESFNEAAKATVSVIGAIGTGLGKVGEFAGEALLQYKAWSSAVAETTVYKTLAAGVNLLADAFKGVGSAMGSVTAGLPATAIGDRAKTQIGRAHV